MLPSFYEVAYMKLAPGHPISQPPSMAVSHCVLTSQVCIYSRQMDSLMAGCLRSSLGSGHTVGPANELETISCLHCLLGSVQASLGDCMHYTCFLPQLARTHEHTWTHHWCQMCHPSVLCSGVHQTRCLTQSPFFFFFRDEPHKNQKIMKTRTSFIIIFPPVLEHFQNWTDSTAYKHIQ